MNNITATNSDFGTVWLVSSVILIPLGVVENIISILVLRKPRFVGMPSQLSLIALCVNDALVLIIGMGRYLIKSVTGVSITDWNDGLCKVLSYVTITMSHISSSIVALICIERLLAIVFNKRAACTHRVQVVGLYVICIWCGVMNVHVLFTTHLYVNDTVLEGCTSNGYEVALVVDCLDAIFLCLIPFIIILSCNCSIVIKLKIVSQKITTRPPKNQSVTSMQTVYIPLQPTTNDKMRSRLDKRDFKVTLTLMIVTMAFFFFNVPFGVVNFLRTYLSNGETPSNNWNIAWLVTYTLVYLNNCVNLPIYTFSHSGFREELNKLLFHGNA